MNCPNCGAPIVGKTCEYCGTQHAKDVEQVTITLDYDYDVIRDWNCSEVYRIIHDSKAKVVDA